MYELKYDNAKLIFSIIGRINVENAADMDKAVSDALDNKEINSIVFDFDKVEYISSAGLRVLLKYKKQIDSIVIQNVSRDVYDIFEVSGFSRMFDIRKKYNQIDISGCEIIGKGGVGTIYRLDDERIAKVFVPGYSIENVENEQVATQNTLVAGVPTMIPFEIAKCGEEYAVVYELLNHDNYANYVLAHPDEKIILLKKYAAFIKEINGISIDKNKFVSQKDIFLQKIEICKAQCTEEEIQLYTDMINMIPDGDGFIHGDCHMKNVMLSDDGLMVIDLTDSGYGHCFYELFSICNDYKLPSIPLFNQGLPEGLLKTILGFDPEECAELWDVFLKEYIGEDNDKYELIDDLCTTYAYLRNLLNGIIIPYVASPEMIIEMKKYVKEKTDQNMQIYKEILSNWGN